MLVSTKKGKSNPKTRTVKIIRPPAKATSGQEITQLTKTAEILQRSAERKKRKKKEREEAIKNRYNFVVVHPTLNSVKRVIEEMQENDLALTLIKNCIFIIWVKNFVRSITVKEILKNLTDQPISWVLEGHPDLQGFLTFKTKVCLSDRQVLSELEKMKKKLEDKLFEAEQRNI